MLKTCSFSILSCFLVFSLTIVNLSHAGLDDKSLVLYLSFDEGKGKTAKDGSQHGHDGELIAGPKWVDGKFEKALQFTGTDGSHVMVPNEDALQTLKTLSIAFWVKRGETKDQIVQVMDDLLSANVDFLTIGQYLQPSVKHHPLQRYVHPDEFEELKKIALSKGFLIVSSSPLTRSSYHADEDFLKMKKLREKQSQCHSLQ